ncbi:hypothetical protein HN358_03070 [Candidatus Uhrbacteria bacterium]|jgi:signal peptidase II|nr:hypothetical protein [Candidatus Uhrbacteria bacterium]MBT7717182.1 hypothetical protein [Candidatus Uhrbacteria bacterium]
MKRNALALSIAIAITIIDGAFKYVAIKQPSFFQEGCLDSIFCLFTHRNYGIAFSIPIPIWATLVVSGIIIVSIFYLAIKFYKETSVYAAPTILILAGALNNFIDRIINGFTTDYLIFFNLSAINLADILIVSGVFITLWYSFSTDMKKR